MQKTVAADVQGVEHLVLDLRLKRTDIGLQDMHAKDGLVCNVSTVAAEFVNHENLQPVKILISGPPCSGKSALADHLGRKYSLPVVRAADLLAASHQLQPHDASAVEQSLKGGKPGPGRVPPEQMAKLGRAVLSGVPHKNRGYILDGFPKTLREARELFTDPRDWSQAELDENAAIDAALASKNPAAAGGGGGGKGTKPGKPDANKGGTAGLARGIDDVADPRTIRDDLMPNVMVLVPVPACLSHASDITRMPSIIWNPCLCVVSTYNCHVSTQCRSNRFGS